MFFDEKNDNQLEQTIAKHDLSLQEILMRIDAMDREVKVLMEELKITPEQIAEFLANKDNFTPENWEELEKQRQKLSEKLRLEKEHVPNPQRTKKAQADRQVERHWLFVR